MTLKGCFSRGIPGGSVMSVRIRSACALAAVLVASAAVAAPPPGVVSLTDANAMGVKAVAAAAASEMPLTTLPATLAPPLNGRVAVSAPFAGVVNQVDVLEGQTVRAGQRLATLFSPDALRVSAELAQAEAEARVAQAAARRQRMLADEGVIAGARAEEAEARVATALAAAAANRRILSGGGGRSGEYVLKAPINGRVAQLNLQPGMGLEAMAPAAIIDRDDRLWVEARLPANLIGKVKTGAGVDVEGRRGRVVAAGSAVDPRTRSAVLRAELQQSAGLYPGKAVKVTVMGPAPAGAVATPRSSLTRIDGRDAVFVRTSQGYRVQTVTVHGQSADRAVISGVAAGGQIATTGVTRLKAAAGR